MRFNCLLRSLLTAPLVAGPIYSVTNLGDMLGSRTQGFAISGTGATVGVSTTVAGIDVPVVHDGSALHALAAVAGQANGINSAGQVVGTTFGSTARATIWDGAAELLPTLGGAESYGLAINSSGDVAGSSTRADGTAHAFLYASGEVIDLDTLGGGWSAAYGVNDSLQVTGYSMTRSGNFRAFLWQPGTGMQEIRGLGGRSSYGMAINSEGSVAGHATTSAGLTRAFLYRDGVTQNLGNFGGASFGYGINSQDHVVGYSYDATGRSRAFVWMDGALYDLNANAQGMEGWTFDTAYGINDSGQIVGIGSYRGVRAAFRLDPIRSAVLPQARSSISTGLDSFAQEVNSSGMMASLPQPVPEPGAGSLLLVGAMVGAFWHARTRTKKN